MPLPMRDVFGACFGIGVNTSIDSISAASCMHHKDAKKKLKSNSNGIPRPPPGMTRSELKRAAQEKLQMDVINHYNFALCGGTGVGKSTLINALLNREDVVFVKGKAHNIFGSAPTGEWQTTMDTFCYAYPPGHDLQYVRLWDTAGLGTAEHPSANYFEAKCLYAFDILMVVVEKELGEYEYTILDNAEKQEISAVIIITKAEEKVNAKIRIKFNTRNPSLADYRQIAQETIDEARQRVLTCLDNKGFHKTPVFIVSAWKYRDFMMEQERLENIGHQEITSNSEACGGAPLGQEISNQGVDGDILADHETRQQKVVEDDSLAKTVLLSFELNQLLDYIANAAVHRRL